jgi:hypothetical protein
MGNRLQAAGLPTGGRSGAGCQGMVYWAGVRLVAAAEGAQVVGNTVMPGTPSRCTAGGVFVTARRRVSRRRLRENLEGRIPVFGSQSSSAMRIQVLKNESRIRANQTEENVVPVAP